MNGDREFEALVARALLRRGAPAPFSIDVSLRVMARVSALGAPPRSELTVRQFGAWAAAASVLGAALTAAAVWNGASLAGAVSNLTGAMADATGAALKLAPPASSLAGTLGRVALALVASARTFVQPLQPLQPLAHAMLAATAAIMISVTSYVVSRDVRKHVDDKEPA